MKARLLPSTHPYGNCPDKSTEQKWITISGLLSGLRVKHHITPFLYEGQRRVLLFLILKTRRKNIVGILYQRYNIITIEYADDLNLLGKTTRHGRKSREAEEPIIGVAYGVMQGNLHASHKALPGDGLFVCVNKKD